MCLSLLHLKVCWWGQGAKRLQQAGWASAEHTSSSETAERSGLPSRARVASALLPSSSAVRCCRLVPSHLCAHVISSAAAMQCCCRSSSSAGVRTWPVASPPADQGAAELLQDPGLRSADICHVLSSVAREQLQRRCLLCWASRACLLDDHVLSGGDQALQIQVPAQAVHLASATFVAPCC